MYLPALWRKTSSHPLGVPECIRFCAEVGNEVLGVGPTAGRKVCFVVGMRDGLGDGFSTVALGVVVGVAVLFNCVG